MDPYARRAIFASFLAAALVLWTASAAGKGAFTCRAAYDGARGQQRAGHLREARDLLLACAKPTCGSLQKKCAAVAGRLELDLGWIVPVVTDNTGAALINVKVKVDGEALTTRLDGRPLAVDPGEHEFAFSARVGPWPGRDVSTTQTITISPGQHGPIAVSLPPPSDGDDANAPEPALATLQDTGAASPSPAPTSAPAPGPAATPTPASAPESTPTPSRRGGPSAFAYLFGGVGLAGLGAGGLLTYWGKTDNAALAQCTPNCQPSSVDHIRRLYLAADLSFGGGAALVGLSTLLFATTHGSEPAPKATAKDPPRRSLVFDVRPARSGAFATVQGVF